jgi:hypothetical protein
MSEQQTCGKGLAARSTLPAGLADLSSALAGILAFHQRSLELTDPSGAAELRTYVRLEEQWRAIAASLASTARAMADARDLPMARHDVTVLRSAENAAIFATFVDAEQSLITLLESSLEKDRAMLDEMRGSR